MAPTGRRGAVLGVVIALVLAAAAAVLVTRRGQTSTVEVVGASPSATDATGAASPGRPAAGTSPSVATTDAPTAPDAGTDAPADAAGQPAAAGTGAEATAAPSPATPPAPQAGANLVCSGAAPPEPAATATVDDVDGDDAPDDVALVADGPGLAVAAGGGWSPVLRVGGDAGPVLVGAGVVDGAPAPLLFVGRPREQGETWRVATLDGCRPRFLVDADGGASAFSVGRVQREDGTVVLRGLWCEDLQGDGTIEVIGTQAVESDGAYRVVRTAYAVEGDSLVPGAEDEVTILASDAPVVAGLQDATCRGTALEQARLG